MTRYFVSVYERFFVAVFHTIDELERNWFPADQELKLRVYDAIVNGSSVKLFTGPSLDKVIDRFRIDLESASADKQSPNMIELVGEGANEQPLPFLRFIMQLDNACVVKLDVKRENYVPRLPTF